MDKIKGSNLSYTPPRQGKLESKEDNEFIFKNKIQIRMLTRKKNLGSPL